MLNSFVGLLSSLESINIKYNLYKAGTYSVFIVFCIEVAKNVIEAAHASM